MNLLQFSAAISADKMDSEEVYKIALSMTPGVTADVVRTLVDHDIPFNEFFSLNMPELADCIGSAARQRFQNASREEALFKARREYEFICRHSIKALFVIDDDYPVLLREIPDAPVVLYVLGDTDLNSQPSINIVGTRRCTAYGTSFCRSFVSDFAPYFPDALIVSGLAYGIDASAHQAALDNDIATVAVMAHGLDTIYPAAHRDLARRIISSGGAIVSEYPSGTRPYRQNFLQRNRIVAGLCELTFVIESEVRGGAMSTANQAFSYSREVFALPGRVSDVTSSGCNRLISLSKANIFTSLADMMNLMNWKIPGIGAPAPRKSLFPELEGDMAVVYNAVKDARQPLHIDQIHMQTGLSMPSLMAALTDLEFEGIIVKLPGARYESC